MAFAQWDNILMGQVTSKGGFPVAVRRRALIACARHCCLCQKFCGTKIECDHIVPRERGGDDVFNNCIPLCFDCHAEVHNYNERHPRGTRYTPTELRKRREIWYRKVRTGQLSSTQPSEADRRTLQDLLTLVPSNGTIGWLRTFHFGGSFDNSDLDDLRKYLDHRNGPDHEFLDPEIEKLRIDFRKVSRRFLTYKAGNTWLIRDTDRIGVPIEWEVEQHDRWVKTIDRLNDLADSICESYDRLVRIARKKLEG